MHVLAHAYPCATQIITFIKKVDIFSKCSRRVVWWVERLETNVGVKQEKGCLA